VRAHLAPQLTVIGSAMAIVAVLAIGRAAWVQVVHADALASAASLVEQRDGGYRYEYNPRLIAASRSIRRGTIYDRQGIPLATSRPDEAADVGARYRSAGITPLQSCDADTPRCYPLAGAAFHVLGDWTTQLNWAASNSSYVERDSDARLKGFDDRPKVVAVVNRRSGATEHAIKRDYSALLPLVRGAAPTPETVVSGAIRAERDVRLTLDARLQSRVAAALRAGIESRHQARGAAVVLDASNGDVLAAVSYPWPSAEELSSTRADVAEASHREAASDRRSLLGDSRMASAKRSATTISGVDRLLDRTRYGLYPPGSTFKLLVAGAALRANTTSPDTTYACVRLPDQRVGTYLPGIPRPIRDDPTDTTPHGAVDLRRGLIVSCNAYFAQLAMRLGPRPLLDAASLFQIEMAQPNTQASLRWALPQAGYGQGQVLVSPLKMARLVAAIAHNGAVPAVRWIRRDAADAHPDAAEQRFLSAGDAALLSRYMREVVTLGTGRTLASNPTPIAGKTGTAEVANGAAHSWFAGFAPFGGSSRKIAFAVIVENAGYGARSAAPIAGEIVTAAREIGLIK
jgi:peptidoglycan glycosyltransferase